MVERKNEGEKYQILNMRQPQLSICYFVLVYIHSTLKETSYLKHGSLCKRVSDFPFPKKGLLMSQLILCYEVKKHTLTDICDQNYSLRTDGDSMQCMYPHP